MGQIQPHSAFRPNAHNRAQNEGWLLDNAHLSGQNLGLALILTNHVHGFQIVNLENNYLLYF